MTEPRHINTCIDEWLTGCPFNLPDALVAIREELEMEATAAREAVVKKEPRDMGDVLGAHTNESTTTEGMAS